MTINDMHDLFRICGEKPTPDILAAKLLHHYRAHEDTRARLGTVLDERRDLIKQLNGALRRRPGVGQVEAERDRYRELYEITLKRNEILSRRAKEAVA